MIQDALAALPGVSPTDVKLTDPVEFPTTTEADSAKEAAEELVGTADSSLVTSIGGGRYQLTHSGRQAAVDASGITRIGNTFGPDGNIIQGEILTTGDRDAKGRTGKAIEELDRRLSAALLQNTSYQDDAAGAGVKIIATENGFAAESDERDNLLVETSGGSATAGTLSFEASEDLGSLLDLSQTEFTSDNPNTTLAEIADPLISGEYTSISTGNRYVANIDESPADSITFGSSDDAGNFIDAINRLSPTLWDDIKLSDIGRDNELTQQAQDRQTRSELRNELDQTLTDAGYDPDNWNTDARADGTLIIQDPDSDQTETIEPGEDADSFNPDTFDAPVSDTESLSSAPESNGSNGTIPDMSGLNRPKVVALIFGIIALIYGATQ